jgi:hypothetical protein
MRKLILGLVPLLAVVAFAAMPAMASANTREYGTCETTTKALQEHPPCGENERHFKAFGAGEKIKVISEKAAGTGKFILEASGEVIECESLNDEGTVENVGGIGKSHFTSLLFDKCKVATGALKGCLLNNIEGSVEDEVLAGGEEVAIFNLKGFVVETSSKPAGCPDESLGAVTLTEGKQLIGKEAPGSNHLVFSKAPNLKFLGEEAFLTGTDATTRASNGKPVYIN